MIIKRDEQVFIMKSFPNIELSYEKTIHKKVTHNLQNKEIYITIPKGNKYFAWFTKYKSRNIVIFLQINRRKNTILSINSFNCNFDNILTSGKGTILYGTIFYIRNYRFFNIEDIFYYKGNNLENYNTNKKLHIQYLLMENYIKQTYYTDNSIIFGLPNISKKYNFIKQSIEKLPYKMYAIQTRNLFNKKVYLNEVIKHNNVINYAHFLVRPTVNTDIYDLYYYNNQKLEKYSICLIPDYKTSVLMNKLFRNIKENINLDLLEESDDEEEFEDISIDKYVFLDKKFIMKCVFNNRFKKWVPLKVENNGKIINKKHIFNMEKK
tara:strand:- start:1855 stop:2820 length:966 start_codon:yes stop_codon:yes gene_type:complete